MAAPVTIYGIIADALASIGRKFDNTDPNSGGVPVRLSARGEQFSINMWNGLEALAQEGSLYCAQTATPGTGIALSVTTGTTFSDTQALICMNNTDTVVAYGGTGKSVYPLLVTIICTTLPTSGTTHHIQGRLDTQPRGTAGTLLGANGTTPRPMNSGMGTSAVGQVFALGASAVAVGASANVRNVGRGIIRAAQWLVGDQVNIVYGARESAAGGVGIATNAVSEITVFQPQVVIAPGHSYVLNEWETARAAAISGELFVLWAER